MRHVASGCASCAIAIIGLLQLLRWLPRRPNRKKRFRIARMAMAHDWEYFDSIHDPAEPGMIFRTGVRRLSTAVVRIPGSRRMEVGNHRFVVDDRLYLYASHDLSTTDPAQWARLLQTLGLLQAKLDQWARWRDVRLPKPDAGGHTIPDAKGPIPVSPAGVAEPGRRLRRAFPWVGALLGILYIGFWIVVKLND